MRKISSYLYPNRIQLLADVAGFSTEYTNVYQRNIKIYSGIDNTLEFDIKNADQKRIDLDTLSNIELNVMDSQGTALPNSPYPITPLVPQTTYKGLAKVIIPQEDLAEFPAQYFKYSVSAAKDGADVLLYCDSRFGAVGTIELVGDAMPTFRDPAEYNTFAGEIDLDGNVINHFSAMPATFYEAVSTTQMTFTVNMTGFIGDIWVERTKHSTISVESFRNSEIPNTRHTFTVANSTPYIFNVEVEDYKYFRVSFQGDDPLKPTGTVDKVIAE
jgi:hypothetical protein